MPLEQRVIEPMFVSRGCVPMDANGHFPMDIPNEFECVTNGTLSNIIRQLSSLSRYADDLFTAIVTDAASVTERSRLLQSRIDRLSTRVLEYSHVEVPLQDIHLRKAFKSQTNYDQQIVARDSMPESVREIYRTCDAPPPLNKLNVFRDDGRDGLKFYTDPNYFFELWRREMLNDSTADRSAKRITKSHEKTKAKTKKVRQPSNSRDRFRQIAAHNEFIESNGISEQRRSRPSQPPPAPPPAMPVVTPINCPAPPTPTTVVKETPQRMSLPPPPPPPPLPPPQAVAVDAVPDPPPPPPSTMPPALPPVKAEEEKPDPRSDLLAAIREGIKLKRVADCKQREVEKSTPLHDVASILARRVAMELSDSDHDNDDEDDSDPWDDESEC